MQEIEALETFDAIVIGTGFGGSVAACRLAQAGYDICVLERGRRYTSSEPHPERPDSEPASDFPALPPPDRSMPDLARWRWSADRGLWDVRDLGGAHCVQAAGYGGGSLVYANVHLRAPDEAFSAGWPDAYRAGALAPYYDLAASMLDVKPITQAPFDLIKTDQMKRVARAVGHEDGLFHPPLTINFKAGENAFGVKQGACRACAECDTGCRYRAKNTLDMNYLAIVDQLDNAQVRTLAEVLLISERPESEQHRYEVEYRDHLQGRERVRIAARWVFVCAGALGSTELLLHCKDAAQRSADHRGLPGLLNAEKLGDPFYLNADALGIVYDARLPATRRADGSLVEGAPRRIDAATGPVITTCITHRGAGGRPWFMLQDGGFPRAFARHVGLMRAPLWMRRNRFGADARAQVPVVEPADPLALKLPQPPLPVPLGDAGGIKGGPLTSVVDGVWALIKDGELKRAVPQAMHEAIDALDSEATRWRNAELAGAVDDVRARLIEQDAKRWLDAIKVWWRKPAPWVAQLIHRVVRGLYDCFARRDKVIGTTQQSFDERYQLNDRTALVERATRYLLGFSDQDAEHSEHSMVLLGMGRDDAQGHLSLDAQGQAKLALDLLPDAAVYTAQERLMRDAASALAGRLRTSPIWAFGQKPITVHAQGGCTMTSARGHGVTDPDGRVHGCEGLYVMDGSVIPVGVGVNPSATIAAIAERNIRIFIEQHPPTRLVPDWDRANQQRAARWRTSSQEWLRKVPGESPALLEPPQITSAEPRSEPIGVAFDERMSGFLSAHAQPRGPADFEAAELDGRSAGCSIELELNAHVRDIAAFIADHGHELQVVGTASLRGFSGADCVRYVVTGVMRLFPGRGTRPQREMIYELVLKPEDGRGSSYRVDGKKYVSDDPGPDAWRDTTALYVTAVEQGATSPARSGVLHVALDEFLYGQMPSYQAIGTDDPARTIWAVSAFVGYFFGTLQRVYLPQLGRAVDLLADIKLR